MEKATSQLSPKAKPSFWKSAIETPTLADLNLLSSLMEAASSFAKLELGEEQEARHIKTEEESNINFWLLIRLSIMTFFQTRPIGSSAFLHEILDFDEGPRHFVNGVLAIAIEPMDENIIKRPGDEIGHVFVELDGELGQKLFAEEFQ